MNKWIVATLALAALFLPINSRAETETIGNYTWTHEIDDDSATLTEISPQPSGALTIPSKLGGKPVTSIGECAFALCTFLESIRIPDSVTSIGDSDFFGCKSLKSITIPKSVTSIGKNAFYDCESLTSIMIPNGVTSIGDWVFDSCKSLTSVRVENPSLDLRKAGIPKSAKVTVVGK